MDHQKVRLLFLRCTLSVCAICAKTVERELTNGGKTDNIMKQDNLQKYVYESERMVSRLLSLNL